MYYYHRTNPISLTVNGNTRKFNGMTFCWDYDPCSECVEYSVALCSFKDHFNRKIGRAIAEGRFKKGIRGFFPMDKPEDYDLPKWSDVIDELRDQLNLEDL